MNLNNLKRRLRLLVEYLKLYVEGKKKKGKKLYLLMTPRHGNLGDHALALAEYKFFVENFPQCRIIEVSGALLNSKFFGVNKVKKIINRKDIIVLHAGGYVGTLWPYDDKVVREVLKEFKENKIIFMPQTVYYSEDELGKEQLKLTQPIYNQCSDLTIFARESSSKKIIDEYFSGAKAELVPDIVLYLDKFESSVSKKDTLLCLRNDNEKTQNCEEDIKRILENIGQSFSYTDTCIQGNVNLSKRLGEVEKKLKEFASAELIVTDRLHGMIFSIIAGTPCVVINSQSHKVKGVYEWVKDIEYVEFVENMNLFENAIKKVMKVEQPEYNNMLLRNHFQPLLEEFNNILK